MKWLSVRVRAAGQRERDTIAAALVETSAAGVQEDGEHVLTFLPAESDPEAVRAAIERASAGTRVEIRVVDDAGWSERWQPAVGLQRVGLLSVAPPWLADEAGDPARAVIIDPAMAFGTGEHPTTRGVLRLLQRTIRPGDVVADLGAGSAVLSIGAAKLSARHVAAIEWDPDAVSNAEANVARNGVAGRVTVLEGDAALILPLVAPVDLILANIISSVLVLLSPAMHAALGAGGRAVLGGILLTERKQMLAVLDGDGWEVVAEDEEGEWWSTLIMPQ